MQSGIAMTSITADITKKIFIGIVACALFAIAYLSIYFSYTNYAYYSYKHLTIEKEGIKLNVDLYATGEFISVTVPEDNTDKYVRRKKAYVIIQFEGKRHDMVEVSVNGLEFYATDTGERLSIEPGPVFNFTFKGEVLIKENVEAGSFKYVPYKGKLFLWIGPKGKPKKHILEFNLEPESVKYYRKPIFPGV